MTDDQTEHASRGPGRAGVAIRGSAVTLMGQLARFGVQLVALVALARLLSPQDFGLVAMVTVITGVAFILGDAGLSMAALQSRELTHQQRSNLFWLNLGIGTALGAFVFVLALPIAQFYDEPDLVPITHAIACVFPLSGFGAQFRAHVTRQLRFTVVAGVDAAAQVIGLAAALVVALVGLGYWAIVAQQLVVAFVAVVGFVVSARWWPTRPRKGSDMSGLLGFGVNTTLTQLLNYASVSVPSVLLGAAWGPTVLGYYNRANALFTMPMAQLAAPITRVVIPVLSATSDPLQRAEFLARAQKFISYFLVGIFAALATFADPLVPLVLGDDWRPAVPVLRVLAIGGVFQALAYVYYWAFVSSARVGTQLAVMLPARLAMIGLAFLGVQWGAVGVAGAVTAGLLLIWLVNSTIGMRLIGLDAVPLFVASVRPVVVYILIGAAATGADVLWFASWPDPARLAAMVGSAAALAAMAWAVPGVRRDIRSIGSSLSTALKRRRPVPS